jgi:hypothetical protein
MTKSEIIAMSEIIPASTTNTATKLSITNITQRAAR